MKKFAFTILMMFVLTVSVFADGEIPIGGKSCPTGQACFVSQTENDKTQDFTVTWKIFGFFKNIFG